MDGGKVGCRSVNKTLRFIVVHRGKAGDLDSFGECSWCRTIMNERSGGFSLWAVSLTVMNGYRKFCFAVGCPIRRQHQMFVRKVIGPLVILALAGGVQACSTTAVAPATVSPGATATNDYVVGAGDSLQIFVWRNPELSMTVRVRPDGRISVPLIEDLPVAGKTPSVIGREIEHKLSSFVKDAVVTVIMVDFVGPLDRQVRVIGEAAKPQAVPYRDGLTALDVLIQAGGLTQYAAGNRASIARIENGKQVSYRIRLDDLLKDGDISANAPLVPGDVLIIPQSYF
ncbi:XrtA/PEP-CTERM system exopolysaccharide export protein [Telmatospirillum sp.]|uniref:XrtA/PEP-CTERM system exopolysaccharide export protein n=1 Tax=Telmatospirillum sp. TaxID=2079197 RepID=UPI00284D758E|nr:XrtA/PEP-CTERM system exopolysaccharide export protein [Telmatospirillum sp.]MDR3439952.1 polysaccharide export protein [Telmatospirillum sp.]